MFQFRRFPSYAYFVQRRMTGYCPAGLPHSDIPGSMDICSSPRLFAACHVLLRLLVPRHSPCALFCLTLLCESRSSSCSLNLFGSFIQINWFSRIFRIHLPMYPLASLVSLYLVLKVQSLPITFVMLVGSSGLEPPTSRLSGARSNQLSYEPISVFCVSCRLATSSLNFFQVRGGDEGIRTHDPLLAKQVLSQLSYTPALPRRLPSAPTGGLVPSKLNNSASRQVQHFLTLEV